MISMARLITQALCQTASWSWGPLMKSLEEGLIGPCGLEIVHSAKVQHTTSGWSAQWNLLHIPGIGYWKSFQQISRIPTGLREDNAERAIRTIGEGRGRTMKERLAQDHIY